MVNSKFLLALSLISVLAKAVPIPQEEVVIEEDPDVIHIEVVEPQSIELPIDIPNVENENIEPVDPTEFLDEAEIVELEGIDIKTNDVKRLVQIGHNGEISLTIQFFDKQIRVDFITFGTDANNDNLTLIRDNSNIVKTLALIKSGGRGLQNSLICSNVLYKDFTNYYWNN